MNPYLQIRGLSKRFGATCALHQLDLSVERGSVLALLGPNGAGKSTLLGCLLGLCLPSAGEVRLQGRPLAAVDRRRWGYLPERVALYAHRSVGENAALFGALKHCPAKEFEAQLERVGLRHLHDRKVCQLSKGMLQRLGLALALCGQPDLLLLDEPFNGLDPALLEMLQAIVREEARRGATLLISTHTMSAIEPLATHVGVLLQGRLVAHGTLDQLRREYGPGLGLEALYHRIAREQSVPEEVLA